MATKKVCDMTPEEHKLHLQKRREYYQNNKDKFKQYSREYLQKNRSNHNEYQRKKYHQDKQFREKLLETNKKYREKRGPEYIKNYMKNIERIMTNINNLNQYEVNNVY